MEKVFKEILGPRFGGVTNIRAVYDFKNHLRGVRPRSADRHIKLQYSLQFKISEDDSTVHVRSKEAINLQVDFDAWRQFLPHPGRPEAIPYRDVVPDACAPKDWTEFEEEIVPSLSKFYNNSFRHPVHIPETDRTEMLQFFEDGPEAPILPEWISWVNSVATENEEDTQPQPVAVSSAADPDGGGGGESVWKPFCQSRSTSTPQHTSSTGTKSFEFPFPVGTWVAFEFTDGLYPGKIVEIYKCDSGEDEDCCRVKFADGDAADYDSDEIHYAIQLYQREFNNT